MLPNPTIDKPPRLRIPVSLAAFMAILEFVAVWIGLSACQIAVLAGTEPEAAESKTIEKTIPLPKVLQAHKAPVVGLSVSFAFSVVSVDADGHIIVWDSDDRRPEIELIQRSSAIDARGVRIRSAVFDRSGLHVYGCLDRAVVEWEIDSGAVIREVLAHDDVVTAVRTVPGEDRCLSSSADGSMILWNMATGTEMRRFGKSSRAKPGPGEKNPDPRDSDGHVGAIRDIVVMLDRKTALSAGDDPVVFVWDIGTGKLVDRLLGHDAGIARLNLSRLNRYLASVDDKSVLFWSMSRNGRKLTYRWKSPGKKSGLVALGPTGYTVAVALDDGSIRLLDIHNKRERLVLRTKGPEIRSMVFLPEGNLLCGTEDGQILIWPATIGKMTE